MPTLRRPPTLPAESVPGRRRALLGLPAWLLLGGSTAWAQQTEPRLKFRTHRAVCECSGDTDDEAIERAAEKIRGKADVVRPEPAKNEPAMSAPAITNPGKPAKAQGRADDDKPTTRRQTP